MRLRLITKESPSSIAGAPDRGASPAMMAGSVWPDLMSSEWVDTRYALHMWTQMVGKIRLALEPMVNHWWQVPLYVSARGLTTSLMHAGGRGLEAEFDFVDHVLELRASDGSLRRIKLGPRSVASFYAELVHHLNELGVDVAMLARPVEVQESIPFAHDTKERAYDAGAVHRYWLTLIQVKRVMSMFRARFTGKVSPIHYFWGGPDLAVTRFSGRRAPQHPGGVPNCPDWVQEIAYSHEVSSCGFWLGDGGEGTFYAYAYPEPQGFAEWHVQPAAAWYDPRLREFVLPYAEVRAAPDPDAMLLDFFQSTYEAAAELAGWDREALEERSER